MVNRSVLRILTLALLLSVTGAAAARAEINPVTRPSTATIVPTPGQPDAMTPLSTSVDPGLYLDKTWPGWKNRGNLLEPPDCHGAAGEHGILEVTNRSVSFLKKDGTPYWASDFDFWILYQHPGRIVDPRAVYDPQTKRFFITAVQVHGIFDPLPAKCHVHLAVSKTDRPATPGPADWWFFVFDVTQYEGGTPFGLDYPGLACDDRALYLVGNMFEYPIFGGNFRNSMVVSIDKTLAAQGVLAYTIAQTPALYDLGHGFTLQPTRLIGAPVPGGVEYFCEVPYDGPVDQVRLWALEDPLGTPTLRDTTIAVPSWGGVISLAPQCIPGNVRTWSPTAQGNAFWRDGSLWFCHASALAGHTAIHWYRVETNGWPTGAAQLGESGTIDPGAGLWAYQPAIGGNALGDVGIVFTQSGSSLCPTPMYSAYRAGTGGFTPPAVLTAGPAGAPSSSWGDYATVTEDPIDHGLWIAHEIHPTADQGDWTQQWGHLRFDDDVAGWPDSGRVVRNGQVEVRNAVVVPSSAGGAVLVWRELDAVWAQRLGADGARAAGWPARGLKAGDGPLDRFRACSDSAGGAYVTWYSDLYGARVTRVDAQGVIAAGWPANGIYLGTLDDMPNIAGTTAGVLLSWTEGGAVAQRISPSGQLLWGANGVLLDTGGWSPVVVPDDAGGALVSWAPGRAQRVASDGTPAWPGNVDLIPDGDAPVAVPDGAGGVIAVFQTLGEDGLGDLIAQRVSGSGALAPGWPAAGAPLCTLSGLQSEPAVLADGAGGVFAVWRDQRTFASTRSDVYAQRLGADGQVAAGWIANGRPVCTSPGHQFGAALAADPGGGIRIAWEDHRGIPGCLNGDCDADVYTQVFHPDGSAALAANGEPVSAASGTQALPAVALLGGGRSLVVWNDGRAVPDCTPWCTIAVVARLYTSPTAVEPPAGPLARTVELAAPEPNPVSRDGGRVALGYRIADRHRDEPLRLEIFDLSGRRVRTLTSGPARAGIQRATWDLRDTDGRAVRPGLYFARLRVGATQLTRNLMVW